MPVLGLPPPPLHLGGGRLRRRVRGQGLRGGGGVGDAEARAMCVLFSTALHTFYAGATITVKATGVHVKIIFPLERLFVDSSSEANNSSDDI